MSLVRYAEPLDAALASHGATHALTISPAYHGLRALEAERLFKAALSDVQFVIAQRFSGIGKRKRHLIRADDVPLVMLVFETLSRSGGELRGLHAHGLVCLEGWGDDAEQRYRASLRAACGIDEDPEKEAFHVRGLLVETAVSSRKRSVARLASGGGKPSFCLRSVYSREWTRYTMKNTADDSVMLFNRDLL